MFVRHLGPCAYPSYWDMGQIPVSALWGIVYARWGQRLGQEKAAGESNNLCKTKRPETLRFRVFLARREGFEPPAFWSVGCIKHKLEPKRLQFVLFATIRSADFPLFPSMPVRFFRILGQNWVKGEKRNWMLIRDSVFHLIIVSVILRANVNMRKNSNTPHTVTSRSAPSGSPPDQIGYSRSDP